VKPRCEVWGDVSGKREKRSRSMLLYGPSAATADVRLLTTSRREPTCGTFEEDEMLRSPFTRLAGSMALAAGVLLIVAQRVMLPFDPSGHVATPHEEVPPCDV
jgi:hypothetical protein